MLIYFDFTVQMIKIKNKNIINKRELRKLLLFFRLTFFFFDHPLGR